MNVPAIKPAASDTTTTSAVRVRAALAVAGLFLLAFIVYSPTLAAGFIWDDDTLLTKNPHIVQPGGLAALWLGRNTPDYFPLTSTTFWLEYRLWGFWAPGYHGVNILLHAANALLAWRILKRLRVPGAYVAAALFVVHPVVLESVAWVAERKNTLSLLGYLLAIVCWLRSEDASAQRAKIGWYLAALVCFAAALLSKTSTVMLPFVLLLLAWWQRGRTARQDVLRVLPALAIAFILGLLTIHFQGNQGLDPRTLQRPWALRAMQAGVSVWFYLYKAMVPRSLCAFYPEAVVTLRQLWAWAGFVGVIVGAALLVRAKSPWGRATAFAGAFFLLNLLPVLGFLNMAYSALSPVSDHFQYIAILAPIAWVAAGLALLARQTSPWSARISNALAIGLIAVLSVATWQQAWAYRTHETLWRTMVARRPTAAAAHANLGYALLQANQPQEAAGALQQAIALDPDGYAPHAALADLRFAEGRWAEAARAYREVVRLQPYHSDARRNLAECLWRTGDRTAAQAGFDHLLAEHPEDTRTRLTLATLLEADRNWLAAAGMYAGIDRLQPNVPMILLRWAICLDAAGRRAEAEKIGDRLFALDPAAWSRWKAQR